MRFADIVTPELSAGAILNEEFRGFREDYLVLHCLMRRAQPRRIFEVGTNKGTGTQILKNAVPMAEVLTLDLPPELAHASLRRPDGKGHEIGMYCKLPFTQLFGDSRTFDFAKVAPIDAFFIDGEHIFENVAIETRGAVVAGARLIVWHDCDIPGVWRAVEETTPPSFCLTRVVDTRIGFAEKESP